MFYFEYEELFKEVYDKALQCNEELKGIKIVVNTHCKDGVEVGKGNDENAGQYRISCTGSDEDPAYTVSGFALGLAMIIYDLKHGEYDFMAMSEKERAEFNTMFHEFYPQASAINNIVTDSANDKYNGGISND